MVVYNQLLRVFTVRLRHCKASEPTASVRKSCRCHADGRRYKCIVHLIAMHALHVTTKTEVRRYRLNASGKRNETENGNKTKRRTVIKRNGEQ